MRMVVSEGATAARLRTLAAETMLLIIDLLLGIVGENLIGL